MIDSHVYYLFIVVYLCKNASFIRKGFLHAEGLFNEKSLSFVSFTAQKKREFLFFYTKHSRSTWQKMQFLCGNPYIYGFLYLYLRSSHASPCQISFAKGLFPFFPCRILLTKPLVRLVGMGEFVQRGFSEFLFPE
jgi:hypothetical protein